MEPKKNRSGGKRRVCLAKNCGMQSRSPNYYRHNIAMFSFPADPERCNAWLKLIGRSEYINNPLHKRMSNAVCSLHFEESDLIKHVTFKLRPDALPFLNLASEMPTTQATSIYSTNPLAAEEEVTTTELRCATDFLETLGMSQSDNYNHGPGMFVMNNELIENIAASNNHAVDDDLSPLDKLRIFIKREINVAPHLRDQLKLRDLALNLLFSNPETYKFLQPNCVMQLPTVTSLSNVCIPTPYGSNSDAILFELLGISLQYMPVAARYCTICITEFKLTPHVYYDITHDTISGLQRVGGRQPPWPADVAVIATLRGLRLPWLQPISSCFLPAQPKYSELDLWLTNIIFKLKEIGIIVEAITVPPTEDFYNYAVEKQISCSNPFFINNVYFIFDAPPLIRRVRDIFIQKDIYVGSEVTKFEFVQTVYNFEKTKNMSLIPNLGSIHLNPSSNMLSTRIAAQTLSRSVAAAINSYVDFESITQEARATANFIQTINDAFDVVNKPERRHKKSLALSLLEEKVNRICTTLTQLNSDDTEEFSKNIRKTGEMFAITVASVSSIILNQSEGYNRFNPRELNLEPLDAMLNKLKAYSKGSTCRQFARSFRSLCKYYMFVAKRPQLSQKANLKQFVERLDSLPALKPGAPREKSVLLLNEKIDYHFVLPEQDELVYIAAYLLYKCHAKHKCTFSGTIFDFLQPISNVKHFEHVNSSMPLSAEMKVPETAFILFVRRLNDRFVDNFISCLDGQVGGALVIELNKVEWKVGKCCVCFPRQYLIKLFVRVRLYIAMKRINKMIKNNKIDYFRI